ncbi:MAG: transcription elongation factor GreA [Spirochaetales bacterium]|nr:transcription elongation factor GreA [Spirochaetales bacterium]
MAKIDMKKITELLNEEKWTRATLNSYTIHNFSELDELIDRINDQEIQDEVKEVCEDHLNHTKNSIIALYISGIISLSEQMIDDSHLILLISIFSDNRKWKIVEFLCNRILDFGENKYALRTLAECFDNENEEDRKYEVWERLIKVDYEEAEIVKQLAEHYEKQGNEDTAIEYYKKAIHRFINKKLFANVKEIWHKLISVVPDEADFYFHLDKKIAKTLSDERASQLLEELYAYYKENENWNRCIEILKKILTYDSKNSWARKEISEAYQQKYSGHSQLQEYIKVSNLNQSWRNVHEAIADFEKHISFDEGNFVCHRTWGIGRIKTIKDDEIIIDFTKKRGHKMALKMAVNALQSLSKNHIWVLKAVRSKESLKKAVKSDIVSALKMIIKSYDNAASMKQFKAELVPSILTQSEWSTWSSEARKILKTDPVFGNLPEKLDMYTVREKPITFDEKTFNRFKAEKNFFPRLQTLYEFLDNADPESDYFNEMFSYFTGFLKAYSNVNEYVISSFLFVRKVIKKYPYLNPGLSMTFKDLIAEVHDITSLFTSIDDSEIRRDFLEQLKKVHNWPQIYIKLLPVCMNRYIIDELEKHGHSDMLKNNITSIFENYRDQRAAFIWAAKSFTNEKWFKALGISYEKILINMIHLLDITFREINNRKDVSENRKLNKQVHNFLFKEENLPKYLETAEQESVSRLFALVNDVKDLDPSIRIELKHNIVSRFPDFKFYGEAEAEVVSRGLIVTEKAYQAKQRELKHIIEVEIPKNSKEIGAAIELGDLKENAEYKAGKEKQELLNITVGRLKEDLERAQIFNPKEISTGSISFGTVVVLTNTETGEDETYAFLGPWESDPENNIISYLSPFGAELRGHKKGEKLKFEINDRTYDYSIKDIVPYNFS